MQSLDEFLDEFYSKEDFDLIELAFEVRKILQYYVDRTVNKKDVEFVLTEAYNFFVLSREIFSKLKNSQIKGIREKFSNLK